MLNVLIAFVSYTVWGIVDYINSRLIFDKFQMTEPRKERKYNYFWLIYCAFVTYAYCAIKHFSQTEEQNIGYIISYAVIYLAFYFRMVPFLWMKYGISIRIPTIYFFYEVVIAVLSTSISVILSEISTINFDVLLMDDLLEIIIAVLVCGILGILYYFKHSKKLNIWFDSMATWEYGLMILTLDSVGTLESVLYKEDSFESYHDILKFLIVMSMFLIIFLVMRMILIKEKNTSMEVVISVLQEQMGKLTEYYGELNKKDEELRQFRHDTKNMMLALQSMIKDGKNHQAIDYIENMGTMYQRTAKLYDTGNFIADALLSTKAQMAEEINTKIIMNGFIPAAKINDVDMVILLSNLLDNAMEACAQVDGEKKILIDSVLGKQMWCIEVSNPTKKNVIITKNRIDTSKENKEIHGYGLMNIERVTKYYNGMLKLTCENNEFVAKATLMLE